MSITVDQQVINAQTNAKIEILAQEMKDFKEEMRDFKGEMRDFKQEMRQQNEMRANEIEASRKRNDELNAKIDEKFEKILSQMQSMAIAAVVGVGVIVAAVVSIMKPRLLK